MKVQSIGLVWISVKDFEKSLDFYTKVLGLTLIEKNEEYGWAELEAEDGGVRLGIAKCLENGKGDGEIPPGHNSVATFSVEDIEDAINDLKSGPTKLIGKVQEIPGHVKLQMVQDPDGNHFQLVEMMPSCCDCH